MPRKVDEVNRRTKVIGIRLTQSTYDMIVDLAKAQDIAPSIMCRRLVAEAIQTRGAKRGIKISK